MAELNKQEDATVRVTNPPSTTEESPAVATYPSCGNSTKKEVETTNSIPRLFQFEVINIVDLAIVLFCGITLLSATFNHLNEVVYTISGGFMGYLGGTGRNLLAQRLSQQTTKTTTTETGKDGR